MQFDTVVKTLTDLHEEFSTFESAVWQLTSLTTTRVRTITPHLVRASARTRWCGDPRQPSGKLIEVDGIWVEQEYFWDNHAPKGAAFFGGFLFWVAWFMAEKSLTFEEAVDWANWMYQDLLWIPQVHVDRHGVEELVGCGFAGVLTHVVLAAQYVLPWYRRPRQHQQQQFSPVAHLVAHPTVQPEVVILDGHHPTSGSVPFVINTRPNTTLELGRPLAYTTEIWLIPFVHQRVPYLTTLTVEDAKEQALALTLVTGLLLDALVIKPTQTNLIAIV